jgi:hypothetical protein
MTSSVQHGTSSSTSGFVPTISHPLCIRFSGPSFVFPLHECFSLLDSEVLRPELTPMFSIDLSYLRNHPSIQPWMRVQLLRWMMEVVEEVGLERKVLYLAVRYIDQYMSTSHREHTATDSSSSSELSTFDLSQRSNSDRPSLYITSSNYQLLGATCLRIGIKVADDQTSVLERFLDFMKEMYSKEDIYGMERELEKVIDTSRNGHTIIDWVETLVKRIVRHLWSELENIKRLVGVLEDKVNNEIHEALGEALRVDQYDQILRYCDIIVLDYDCLSFLPSEIAFVALYTIFHKNEAISRFLSVLSSYFSLNRITALFQRMWCLEQCS